MATILKWFINSVIAPLIINWLVVIYKKIKQARANNKRSDENIKAADEYEKSPTADNLNNLP
jgi:hypothetical protein